VDISDNKLRLTRDLSHEKHKKFPPEKKIEVVTKWMALGNMRLVSELTGVSYQLCRMWKQQPWWADLVAEIKASRDIQVDNKLSKLVDKSLAMVADRLENGNIVWNKKLSQIENIPVSISEATKVADVLLTQQLNLSKKKVVESQGDTQKTIKDQIANLALEFARFNTKRTVEVVGNAVHDQRAPGLQAAVRELRWEAGEHQEAGLGQQGQSDDGEGGESTQGGWQGRGSPDASEQGWEDNDVESPDSEPSPESFIL
jgi:hypothetical protein